MSEYNIEISNFEELTDLEGAWTVADYVAILDRLDVDDAASMPADEAREMCLLALQDLELDEAASVVLEHKLGSELSAGQIKHYSTECAHEKLWEESGNMDLHHSMFDVGSLLFAVNEAAFPTPDAVCVTLMVHCPDAEAATRLMELREPAFLVRLLSAGMSDEAILRRLFDDQLQNGAFPEAAAIIWGSDASLLGKNQVQMQVISSGYWLDALRETESFSWLPNCTREIK